MANMYLPFIMTGYRHLIDHMFILRARLHLSLAREKALTINVPAVVNMGREYGFEWGEIHKEGRLKWWALKVDTYLGP